MRHVGPMLLVRLRSALGIPPAERRAVRAILGITLLTLMLGARCGESNVVSEGDRHAVEEAAIRHVIAFYWADQGKGPLDIEFMLAREEERSGQLVQLDQEVMERIRTFYLPVLAYSGERLVEANAGSFEEIGPPWGGEAEVLIVVNSVKRIGAIAYDVRCRWHCGRLCGGRLRLTVKGIGDRRTVTDARLEAVF